VVTNFVQFQTTNICYNSAISWRTSLFIYAMQHWSGSCRTGCYGPVRHMHIQPQLKYKN